MASPKEDLRARLLTTFQAEAEEHLQVIALHLGALDRGLPPEQVPAAVEATFRALHTLKGAARSVGLDHVEALCQSLESLLSRVKKGQIQLDHDVLASLQRAMDDLGRLLSARPAPAPADRGRREAPAPGGPEPERTPPAGASPAGAGTIRVDTARLDALHARAEDLLASKLAAVERAREARAMVETLDRCRAEAERSAAVQPLIRQAGAQARGLLRTLVAHQRTLGASVDGLQEEARRLRMMPAAAVLDSFPRMVGEMARAQGKEVDWSAQGADLELDRKVLETVKEALIHLVRNALDHGIEPPQARERQGRPRRGRVAVTFAPLEGRRVEVRVEDDGAGIDPAGIRAAAVRARLRSPEEAEALPDEAALSLIFASGLSTSPVITDLSGHGLGMAIVRDRVERLGGRVSIDTRRGAGTTVRMVLPASVATFRGLLVRAGRQSFLLPLDALERAHRLAPSQVETAGGREAIRWEGRAVPFARLARVLGRPDGGPAEGTGGRWPCLIVASGGERAALMVDEVLGEHEVLVKELRPPLVRVRHVAGAGLLGSGELALILRPADLLRAAREATSALPGATPAKAEEAGPSAILVVDDSITTRTMEKNLLEAAGYKVQVAADGIEAWSVLKTERFDLVVSDVDMPRLNGFDLTSRIRADPELADLPVVLVTALESREDKERGIEVGANAYVIKSGFDQSKLLDIVRRLV
jgi:two-component system chemotaxis sensor kinase CheA